MSENAIEVAEGATTQAEVVEVATEATPAANDPGYDPSAELAQLRAERDAERKKNEFLRRGFVEAKRPAWVKAAMRQNPELADMIGEDGFRSIEAPSGREYERRVQELAAHPLASAYRSRMQASKAGLEALREQAHAEGFAAGREEAAAAWGRPSADMLAEPSPKPPNEKEQIIRKLVGG